MKEEENDKDKKSNSAILVRNRMEGKETGGSCKQQTNRKNN